MLTAPTKWEPLPGAQTAALSSKADILLYGGAAGGGKSALLMGAARQHYRAIVFRRIFPNLSGLIDESKNIYPANGDSLECFTQSPLPRWRFKDGSQIDFAAMQYEKDKENFKGRAHSFYGFDEITEFTESQFRFVTTWNRSARPGERCRIICTCNPPTSTEGEWIIRFWAPWLDDKHPNPAKPGELRWFTTIDGKDVEVLNGKPFEHNGEILIPRSRTFIPARLADNPYLASSGYAATLQALPEPLRSQMLYGSFTAAQEDHPYQVIPTAWVRAAQERWRDGKRPDVPLSALGIDVARGGRDKTVLAPRFDNWFHSLISEPGKETPDGQAVASIVIKQLHALGGNEGTRINIDIIGVGSSPYDFTKSFHKNTYAMNGAEGSEARDKSGQLGFVNKRAEWWWKFREKLDPASGENIAIPDDREILADLCSARWELKLRGIQIEPKENIKDRLGRSPDKGEAIIYASSVEYLPGEGWLSYTSQEATKAKAAANPQKAAPGTVRMKAPRPWMSIGGITGKGYTSDNDSFADVDEDDIESAQLLGWIKV